MKAPMRINGEFVVKPEARECDSAVLLDVAAVARLLGVSKRSVLRRVDEGELPRPILIGRLARWRRSDIVAWLEHKFQEANPTALIAPQSQTSRILGARGGSLNNG
jgi:excisionase family DNA binding protein